MQESTTAQMLFAVAHLVQYITQFMMLYPGDVISTGTPAGVALGRRETPTSAPVTSSSCWISRLGRARQRFEAAP